MLLRYIGYVCGLILFYVFACFYQVISIAHLTNVVYIIIIAILDFVEVYLGQSQMWEGC